MPSTSGRDPIDFCGGKKRFHSFDHARTAAKRSGRAKGRENEHYAAYHCMTCQGFHVGSRIGKTARKPRFVEDAEA